MTLGQVKTPLIGQWSIEYHLDPIPEWVKLRRRTDGAAGDCLETIYLPRETWLLLVNELRRLLAKEK